MTLQGSRRNTMPVSLQNTVPLHCSISFPFVRSLQSISNRIFFSVSVWGLSAGHWGQHGGRGEGHRDRPSGRGSRGEGRCWGVSAEAAAQEEAAEEQDELHAGADRGSGERSGHASSHARTALSKLPNQSAAITALQRAKRVMTQPLFPLPTPLLLDYCLLKYLTQT